MGAGEGSRSQRVLLQQVREEDCDALPQGEDHRAHLQVSQVGQLKVTVIQIKAGLGSEAVKRAPFLQSSQRMAQFCAVAFCNLCNPYNFVAFTEQNII